MRMFLSGGLAAGFLLALTLPASAAPKADPTAGPREAFQRYDAAWNTFNAQEIVDCFADDFDWVNSVGLRFSDKRKLKPWLEHLFADADFRAGTPGKTEVESVRMLGPDTAVVISRQRTDGKINSANEKVVKVLYTDELTVFHRIKGHWLVVSDLAADEASGI